MAPPLPKVKVYDPAAERLLASALRQRARGRTELVKLTQADAVALTGLPSEQAAPALKSLVATYRSHVAVTDDGDLVYAFDPSLERRDQVPLRERLEKVGEVAWKGFTFLFKISIVVTLIVYVLAFVAMMIALMMRGGDDRDDRRGGGGGLPWIWFWLMPDLAPPGYGRRDAYGRPLQQRRDQPKKRFYQSVFDFVFGPKTAPVAAHEADRRLLSYLRDHKGRVTASELSALTGLSLAQAEEEMTRLMVAYDGEVDVAEDGTLIYRFEELLPSAAERGIRGVDERWNWSWDQPDPVAPLTGNTGGADLAIGGFAGFNLLASLTIAPAFLQRFRLDDPALLFWVMVFPLIFSAVFFAVPAARWVVRRRRLKRREQRQLRRGLMREIWSAPATPRDPDELAARAAQVTGQPKEAARKLLEELLRDLDGDVTTDAEGRVRYTFPRLAEEQAAVRKARAEATERRLGEVIFSSEDSEEPVRG